MKIISGRKREPWWIGMRGECEVCGTVVELDRKDIDGPGWVGNVDRQVQAGCPNCYTTIVFTEGKLSRVA